VKKTEGRKPRETVPLNPHFRNVVENLSSDTNTALKLSKYKRLKVKILGRMRMKCNVCTVSSHAFVPKTVRFKRTSPTCSVKSRLPVALHQSAHAGAQRKGVPSQITKVPYFPFLFFGYLNSIILYR
jgi:hypothetical protein